MTLVEKLLKVYKTGSPLKFAESNGVEAIAWTNSILQKLEERSLPTQVLDFKTAPTTPTKEKTCKKGYACGGSCIAKGKKCKQKLDGDAVKAADYLDAKVHATNVGEDASPPVAPKGKSKKGAKKKSLQPDTPSPQPFTQTTKEDTPLPVEVPQIDMGDSFYDFWGGEEFEFWDDARPEGFEEAAQSVAKITGTSSSEAGKITASLIDYTSSAYYANLRAADRGTNNTPLDVGRAEAINKYIKAAPKHEGEMFRGMQFSSVADRDKFLKEISEGMGLDAFSSFSAVKDISEGFAIQGPMGGTVWKNKAPLLLKVANNKSGASIDKFSYEPHQKEILVPKGVKYKVVETNTVETTFKKKKYKMLEVTIEEI